MTVLKIISAYFASSNPAFRVLRVKRSIIQISSALVLTTIAGAVIVVFFFKGSPGQVASATRERPSMNGSVSTELTFRQIANFDGRTKDGARFSEQHYKSSDCVRLSSLIVSFRSAQRSLYEVQNQAASAVEVLDRGNVFNNQGQPIGERIVMRFVAKGEQEAQTRIISNKGPTFLSITSPSLRHALEFERAGQSPDNRKAFPGIDSVRAVRFETAAIAEGVTSEGIRYREEEFNSSDCERLAVRTLYFGSSASAQDQLQRELKETTNLMEQGPKLNGEGQQVGQRAVAMFRAGSSSERLEDTMVIWTENSEFHAIRGPFIHVLEFEKRQGRQ